MRGSATWPATAASGLSGVEQLLRRAVACHQRGERDRAASGYDAVLQLVPDQADALHLKGVLLHESGDHAGAIRLIRRAIAVDAGAAPFHLNLGNALQSLGDISDAIASFETAVALAPGSPDAAFNLGIAQLKAGRLADAVSTLRHCLQLDPNRAHACFTLGAALHDLGRVDESEAAYRQGLAIDPGHAPARVNLGLLLQSQGKAAEALAEFSAAEAITPGEVTLDARIGSALLAAERWPEAIARYDALTKRTPLDAEAWLGLGLGYRGAGQPEDARSAIEWALELDPSSVQCVFQLAMVLTDLALYAEAGDRFAQALSLRPEWPEAHFNLANALRLLGRDEEAAASYHRALALRPNYEAAHWNLSLSLLRQGRLEEGWVEHEWRWDAALAGGKRQFPQPLWNGESGDDLQVLVWREQGIGDELMFASCLPDLLERVGHVIYACHPKLRKLLQRSFPAVELWDDLSVVDPAALTITHHTPIGSLPRIFRRSVARFPRHTGYLKADPIRVDHWRNRLAAIAAGPWIGISWRSRLMGAGRAEHYSRVEEWGPIFRAAPGVNFVNLQYDDCSAELATVAAELGVTVHQLPDIDLFNNLDEVAALTMALDLVLAPDNSVGETTAALGKPIWRLDSGVDWSTLGTEQRPWQPGMRLFRRVPGHAWTQVIESVAAALQGWVRGHSGEIINAA
jgi:tetratricopeptide (TPR) repeat protein